MKRLAIASLIYLVGCGSDAEKFQESANEVVETKEESKETVTQLVANIESAESCDAERSGHLIYAQEQSSFYFCDSKSWQPIDLKGKDGKDGAAGQDGKDGLAGKDAENIPDMSPKIIFDHFLWDFNICRGVYGDDMCTLSNTQAVILSDEWAFITTNIAEAAFGYDAQQSSNISKYVKADNDGFFVLELGMTYDINNEIGCHWLKIDVENKKASLIKLNDLCYLGYSNAVEVQKIDIISTYNKEL